MVKCFAGELAGNRYFGSIIYKTETENRNTDTVWYLPKFSVQFYK
jgi:hypothetical protein